ncbi:hypothetical protein ACQPYK_46780 [Streptosporangium sp. CA-135522]|uniref:hypothetical protein n=1 Tax=Streptosporangium sp. CA-135522 TaxID=3240072 RepID=UPI003D8BAA6E
MSDPYRIDPGARPSAPRQQRGGSLLRVLLWILLVVGVAVNLVSNIAMKGDLTPVGLAGGVVGVASIVGLVVHYISRRRS